MNPEARPQTAPPRQLLRPPLSRTPEIAAHGERVWRPGPSPFHDRQRSRQAAELPKPGNGGALQARAQTPSPSFPMARFAVASPLTQGLGALGFAEQGFGWRSRRTQRAANARVHAELDACMAVMFFIN